MEPIHVAFLWHQHQPFYKDLVTGRYRLPWVRLHAIKDYIGMPLVLREFPDIRATINLVPSLIVQIEEYAAGQAEDEHLRLTRKPAEELDEAERRQVLRDFFVGNPAQLIRVVPRYAELLQQRNACKANPAGLREMFSPGILRDIQVWATLAWFHPLVVAADNALKELRGKGRNFTEEDKAVMLQRQDEVIRRVLPLHRELAEAGQIEISTTPFHHPILPLLCNMESAREALPDVPMPERRSDLKQDAVVQIDRAIELHKRVFGQPPTGMWPAEGSVSEDILPLLKGRGIRWIATDEGILARSIDRRFVRDKAGDLKAPDTLYQPYALPGEGAMPCIVFRDHALSDAIGFKYHRQADPRRGVGELVEHLLAAGRRCKGRPRLISIILDGENPWDCYEQAGLIFLRVLYTQLSREKAIITTRLSDYVQAHPPKKRLPRLAAGSWIDSNFAVWVGGKDDRAAWSLVAEARETLARKLQGQPGVNPGSLARAWEEIYIAEGSDWYWWFGEDRTSGQDYLFDEMFRSHLANVYHLIGQTPPDALSHPIGKAERAAPFTEPRGQMDVTLDGRPSDNGEWAMAGHASSGHESSAMRRSSSATIRELYFGCGPETFFLRLDASAPLTELRAGGVQAAVNFVKPRPFRLVTDALSEKLPRLHLFNREGNQVAELDSLAAEDIIELGCPTHLLGLQAGDSMEFFVEVLRDGEAVQRIPREGSISAFFLPHTP